MHKLISLVVIVLFAETVLSSVKVETVTYKYGAEVLEGYLAYDDTVSSLRPGMLIVHDWLGNSEFTKKKAEQLAKMGYVGFALDIYGKGVRPKNSEEAGKLAGKYKADRKLLRAKARAAYDFLSSKVFVDKQKIAIMGYCFGGTTALELARSGAPLTHTISFHGGLANPSPQDAKNISGKVLVLHGADDPFVPEAEVNSFRSEMDNAKVKFTFVAFPGAVHSFTNPLAGDDVKKGAAYNAAADAGSWKAFEGFINPN